MTASDRKFSSVILGVTAVPSSSLVFRKQFVTFIISRAACILCSVVLFFCLTGNDLLLHIFTFVYHSLLMSTKKDLCIWASLSRNVDDRHTVCIVH